MTEFFYESGQATVGPLSSKNLQTRRASKRDNSEQRFCSNCGTSTTSTWRTLDSKIVCNACKCFYRKHGYSRPLTMRKDTISSRNRSKTRNVFPHESVFTIPKDTNTGNTTAISTPEQPVHCEEWEAARSFCVLLQSYYFDQ